MNLVNDLENFEELKQLRMNWDALYQKISDYMIPDRADFIVKRFPGQRRDYKIFDSTALWAGQLLAAGLHTMLTSPGSPWFYLSTGIPELDEDQEIAQWLQDVQGYMNSTFNDPVANFQSQIHELYLDLVYLGTATMYVGYHDKFMFRTHFLGECYIDDDEFGQINSIYRSFSLSKANVIRRFGDQKYGDYFEKMKSGKKIPILNVVVPDGDEFSNRYWMIENKMLIQSKTYSDFPYVVPRWEKSSAEIMGRSPAMTALPDVLMVNEMSKTVIRAAHLATRPPLQAPDKGYISPISIAPEAISYYDSTSTGRISPIMTGVNPNFGDALLAARQKAISRAFHIDMLLLPGQQEPGGQNPYMSATEATIRRDNQMRLIGPTLSRLQHELLGPLVHRVFSLMKTHKLLPDIPSSLEGITLKVEYRSPLAVAQRAAEGENLSRALAIIAPLAQINPGVLDIFSGEEVVRWAASITHTPQKLLLTKTEIEQMRKQAAVAHQQQIQANQDAMTAKNNIDAATALGKTMKAL